jgi:hypothetical protein
MPNRKIFNFTALFILLGLVFAVSAQTKRNQRTKQPTKTAVQTETKSEATPEPTPPPAGKKNSRPTTENSSDDIQKTETQNPPAYVYEFSQPAFVISHIRIEHDENGKGKITFLKKDFDEEFTDPVQLSAVTLEKLKTHFDALNFLDSTEDYQYEKDYSHLGNMKITMRSKDGKERTAAFNWTTNADAKAIADEYRKLANQYIWMFDITVARQNQPLETPRIMKALDGYISRDGISDPPQMIPFLKDLSNDERVPLITRNNAAKLIKEIEKKKNK